MRGCCERERRTHDASSGLKLTWLVARLWAWDGRKAQLDRVDVTPSVANTGDDGAHRACDGVLACWSAVASVGLAHRSTVDRQPPGWTSARVSRSLGFRDQGIVGVSCPTAVIECGVVSVRIGVEMEEFACESPI